MCNPIGIATRQYIKQRQFEHFMRLKTIQPALLKTLSHTRTVTIMGMFLCCVQFLDTFDNDAFHIGQVPAHLARSGKSKMIGFL